MAYLVVRPGAVPSGLKLVKVFWQVWAGFSFRATTGQLWPRIKRNG